MHLRFLRHFAAVILVTAGVSVGLFSLPVAFGWGHRTLSVLGIVLAIVGYAAMFVGHWFLRDSDWQVMASSCIKWFLLLGSTLLMIGVLAVAIHPGEEFPYGYLVVSGCLSFAGYWRFRKYNES